ncbi:MAG TPA: ABC transporter ATP-binding protein [Candidatus Saccharimonadales bacterium]|nr:ABC transporter ATP-binding protein [Candidatus Saccharimonadales bacterium]
MAARTNPPVVEIRDLRRSFGEREALKGVTFDVAQGDVFALLGPKGGGKTTLFRILATLLPPTSGEARIFGESVASRSAVIRRRLGVVFQSPSLDPRLTVMENMVHHGHLHGMRGAALQERSRELLGTFGVADRQRDRVETLSGGLARRVELAKSLLHRPDLLLLDEPSTGLDPAARLDFMQVLLSLRDTHGVTVILTTHFLEEADRAGRVGILDGGRLVETGAPQELRARIGGDVVTLTAASPADLASKLSERFGHPAAVMNGSVRVEAPRGHEFVRDAVEAFGKEIRSATFGRPTLEDVFVRLTGHRLGGEEAA